MQDTRACHVLDVVEDFDYALDIVAVERTEISDVESFENVLMMRYQ